MYKYEGSLVLKVRAGSIFSSPYIENEKVHSLYSQNYKTFLVLSHPSVAHELYLNMADVKQSLGGFIGTVKEWLVLNGSKTLPTTKVKPDINKRYVRYAELTRSGYALSLGNSGLHYPPGVDRLTLRDVVVQRPETDMVHVQNTSLLTVNGFIHHSSAVGNYLYISEGHTSAKIADRYSCGLITFTSIGKLTRYKLLKENIVPFENGMKISEKMRFTVPEIDKNKPFFLVMGGYLIFPKDGVFFRTEEDAFCLDLEALNIVERMLESSNFIDLTGLGLTQPNNMEMKGWYTKELLSDEVIRRYLTLSQSFLVTVDAPNLNVVPTVLTNESYPGKFLVSEEPVDPIIGAHGRLMEYWPIQTSIGWEVNVYDNYRRDYLYSASGPDKPSVVNHSLDIRRRGQLTGGYSLEISSSI